MAEKPFSLPDVLLKEGWEVGHAPPFALAQKVKYKGINDTEWQPFHRIVLPGKFELVQGQCILTFVHDAHVFPLGVDPDTGIETRQQCPGISTEPTYWAAYLPILGTYVYVNFESEQDLADLLETQRKNFAGEGPFPEYEIRRQSGYFTE